MSEIEVSLFAPVRPMLADTWSPNKLRVLLKGTMLYAEVKYDGDRCQLHKRGNQYKYFSRAGNDNTDVSFCSASVDCRSFHVCASVDSWRKCVGRNLDAIHRRLLSPGLDEFHTGR